MQRWQSLPMVKKTRKSVPQNSKSNIMWISDVESFDSHGYSKGFHLRIAVKSEMMGYVLTFISCLCCLCVLHDFWKGLIEDSRLVSPGSLGPLSILSSCWDGSAPQKEDWSDMNWKRRIWGKRGINLQRFLQWWLVYILSRSLMDELGFKDGVLALRGWGCWRSAATWLVYFPCIFSDRGRLCETCQMKTDMFGVWILIQALHSDSDINNATPLSIRAEIMECEDLWCSWCLVKENLARPGPGAMQEVLDLWLFWPTTPVRLLCYKVILLVRKSIVALFSICTQAGLERAKFFSSWSEILFEKSGFAGWCELVICKYGPNRLMIGEFKVGKVPRNQTLLHQTEAVWLRWHDDRYGEVAG